MPEAIAVLATAYGGPEVLAVEPVELPAPGPGEVLVDVRAAGLNPFDWKLFSGRMGADPAALPRRIGLEASGVIAEVGPDGAQGPRGPLAVGAEVIVYPASGTWATRFVARASSCLPKPSNVSWEAGAGTMATGVTAVHMVEAGAVGDGDVVLVHGGAGGVGRTVVQLARARGAARVIATARPANHDALRALGAEPIAYGDGLADRIRALAPDGVDVALDCVGTDEAIETSVQFARDRGRLVTIAAMPPADLGFKVLGGFPGADPGTEIRDRARGELVDLLASGALTVATASYPLADAAAAVRDSQQNAANGKIVLVP